MAGRGTGVQLRPDQACRPTAHTAASLLTATTAGCRSLCRCYVSIAARLSRDLGFIE